MRRVTRLTFIYDPRANAPSGRRRRAPLQIEVDEQRLVDVRFAPESGHSTVVAGCPLWANTGHCGLFDHLVGEGEYARWKFVSPSAFAVLRLITNSNLVGCNTGRSTGFSPLRILPA